MMDKEIEQRDFLNDLVMKVDEISADKVIYQHDASMKANNRSTINIYRLCASVISKL